MANKNPVGLLFTRLIIVWMENNIHNNINVGLAPNEMHLKYIIYYNENRNRINVNSEIETSVAGWALNL